MNENINIAEILKDAPRGTKLYSPLLGECKLYRIDDSIQPIIVKAYNELHYFTKYGQYLSTFSNSECLLFPSKENRDWSSFKIPCNYKHFEPLQWVLVKFRPYYSYNNIWEIDFYSHYDDYLKKHKVLSYGYCTDDNILPYEGNEDKLGKSAENEK